MFLFFWWAYADASIENVSIDFCGTSKSTILYRMDAGKETDVCYTIKNDSAIPVQVKIWFVDGTYTNDQQQNKACLGDVNVEKFWKQVSGYDQFVSLKAGESLKKSAKILYATGVDWLFHGCIVYSLVEAANQNQVSGISVIVRKAKFIDVIVGTPKTAQGQWIILENFSNIDGENISRDPKIRIYKESTDQRYVIQIKVKNVSSVEQDVIITGNISNIFSYQNAFVETRKILAGETLIITKTLEENPPYNLKINFIINNTPFHFATSGEDTWAVQEENVWTIKEEVIVWTGNVLGYLLLMIIIAGTGVSLLLMQEKKRRKKKLSHHVHHRVHPLTHHKVNHLHTKKRK